MDERSDTGSEPRGPAFAPPSAPEHGPVPRFGAVGETRDRDPRAAGLLPLTSPPRTGPPPRPTLPPRDPWPTLLTVVAVVVVGAVVVAATLLGGRADRTTTSGAAPAPAPAVRPAAGPRSPTPATSSAGAQRGRMEFVSDDGDGVLVITSSQWTTTGARRPTFGTYLHIEVELVCTTGQLSYGPENFSAFDAVGELFEVNGRERWGTPLGDGIIWAGQSVRGTIAFDLPRGEVTLLLSDSTSKSVTAVKIPD